MTDIVQLPVDHLGEDSDKEHRPGRPEEPSNELVIEPGHCTDVQVELGDASTQRCVDRGGRAGTRTTATSD
jgi:hypothetical protein